MALVMRSTPFCRPMEQIKKPSTTTTTIQKPMVTGWLSMPEKASATWSVSMPSSWPARER